MSKPTRVAIVTGAAGGIGASVAARLRSEGVAVVGADLTDDRNAGAMAVDVRDDEDVDRLMEQVIDRHGRLDIVVNCAGVNLRRTLAETTPSQLESLVAVNVGAAFRVALAARPHLVATHGCVVNVASTAGILAIDGAGAYGVSKAALIHLTRVMALEWADNKIRVNAVAPTIVPTAMTADVLHDENYMTRKLASIPLGRVVEREEVADAITFLCSDDAQMITGQVLAVDGGVTLR